MYGSLCCVIYFLDIWFIIRNLEKNSLYYWKIQWFTDFIGSKMHFFHLNVHSSFFFGIFIMNGDQNIISPTIKYVENICDS